jgi:hypothetical protein
MPYYDDPQFLQPRQPMMAQPFQQMNWLPMNSAQPEMQDQSQNFATLFGSLKDRFKKPKSVISAPEHVDMPHSG